MNKIQKIKRYIDLTPLSSFIRSAYQMHGLEMREITLLGMKDLFNAISLAYTYGLAKGYRAAKAEAKRAKAWES